LRTLVTIEVSIEFLELLFKELCIWENIHAHKFLNYKTKGRPSSHWPRATSYIIRHSTPNGNQVATTHCVRDNKGKVLHWDAKDIRINDVCFWRR
jgi:hypothetical protein